ncbi:arylsulfatase, partial [Streptomyces sp. NPDC056295]
DQVGRAVRTERWKYVVSAPPGTDAWREPAADRYRETELYDLDSDPYELENLVGLASHREVADGLREALAGWLLRVEGAEPAVEPAEPRSLPQRSPDSFPHGRVPWEGVRFGHR